MAYDSWYDYQISLCECQGRGDDVGGGEGTGSCMAQLYCACGIPVLFTALDRTCSYQSEMTGCGCSLAHSQIITFMRVSGIYCAVVCHSPHLNIPSKDRRSRRIPKAYMTKIITVSNIIHSLFQPIAPCDL